MIDAQGVNQGIIKTETALRQAVESGLDLVAIETKTDPPVVKIVDLGKHIYELEKKERDSKRRQKETSTTKGIRISVRMSSHDLKIQAQKLDKFLDKGNKIRVEIIMHGREKALQEVAHAKVDELLSMLEQKYKIDQEPQRQPRGLYLLLSKA